jgi:hypothetical protein
MLNIFIIRFIIIITFQVTVRTKLGRAGKVR